MSARGHAIIPRWLLYDATVSTHAKMTYIVLQSYTSKYATSFPAMSTIAANAGISESTARRAIKELQALGVVDVRPRRRRSGGATSNEYTVRTTL